MLTYFRKIRKSLLEGGRTTNYLLYAIGEIALVVMGILIALQINNWNEWRKERKLEKEILSDLQMNLESNVIILNDRVDYFTTGDLSASIILNVIDQNLPYHDSLGIHFSKATRGFGGADVISYVGYETLKNKGFFTIANKSLRDEIIQLFENTYRDVISIDETFKLQNAYHREVLGNLLFSDKRHSLKPFDFSELMESNPYYSSVTDHQNNYRWMREETIHGLTETKRILQLIKDELDE